MEVKSDTMTNENQVQEQGQDQDGRKDDKQDGTGSGPGPDWKEDKPASNGIDQLHVPVQPKPFQLGEDVKGGELLQVEDLDVRHPDLVHQGDVHGDQRIVLVSKLKYF